MNEFQQKQYDKLKEFAESKEWKVLSEVYVKNGDKMKFQCPKGHIGEKTYKDFMRGYGCPKCSGKSPEQARENFYKIIEELGGKVLGEYCGNKIQVKCFCKEGHECNPKPNSIINGQGMCQKCSGNCPEQARENFYKQIEELGGKVLGEYCGNKTPVKCLCKEGHECNPMPSSIRRGQGMCLKCVNKSSEQARENFYKQIEELGGKVLGEYKNNSTPVKCLCKEGHECNPMPSSIREGQGMCLKCAGNCPEQARENFYKRIEELGGKVLGEYQGANISVKCICKEGHECNPNPSSIRQGHGMCKKCSNCCPEQAKENFYKRIEELGGKVLGEYQGSNAPVKCLCPKNHICNPRPATVQQGHGMCIKCIDNCPEQAKENFLKSIEELGGKVLGEYKNNSTPIKCLCKEGHECTPMSSSIQGGQGMCLKCAGNCPEQARENFYKKILELGGTVLGEYQGANIPVKCLCKEGHECTPMPSSIQQGGGMCLKCVGQCPEQARENFYKRIEELGGTVLGEYQGKDIPVKCLCKEGHECNPRPSSIRNGQGMCPKCSDRCPEQARDNFYKKIEELGGKVLGEYQGSNTPVKCLCPKNHICNPRPTTLKQNPRWIPCSLCLHKTEGIVNDFLTPLYTSIQREAKFDWCRNPETNRYLPFDFLLPQEKIFIEIDGFHHFEDVEHHYTKAEDIQERDIYKMKCAIQNGYKIIRIVQEDIFNENFVKILNFTASWEAALNIAVLYLLNTPTNILCISSENGLYDYINILMQNI